MHLNYLQGKFRTTLHPLGGGPALEGIYAIKPNYLGSKLVGVTGQFLEHAGDYDVRYFDNSHWQRLIRLGLTHGHFAAGEPEILDLGSGSGNSVLPVLDAFPDARVVATDISPQVLALLRKHLAGKPGRLERCGLVCADATEAEFEPASFDIVIGGAVLHHLLDPAHAIRQSCRCVRPGGCAIFFEPFEFGSAMLRVIYESLMARKDELGLRVEVVNLFERVVTDVKVRAGADMSAPIFRELDDKWLFTRTYFEEQARANKASLKILPIHSLGDSFREQTRTYLRLVLGRGDEALPERAWDIIHHYDHAFSEDLKAEMLIEGCIIFRK